jgi:hypothetical protein
VATFTPFNSFSAALATKKHNIANGGDVLTIALCATANAPVAGNTVLANLTTISPYTNLSSRVVAVNASTGTTGAQYRIVLDDLTLTASGGAVAAFQYVVLYNDTAANDELIGWIDYGSAITLASGDGLVIDFSAVSITVGA